VDDRQVKKKVELDRCCSLPRLVLLVVFQSIVAHDQQSLDGTFLLLSMSLKNFGKG
jgi:hypothetical protein